MKNEQKHTALAVCEACSLIWGVIIVAGAAYLVGWQGWSNWTWVGMLFLMECWTCKYCPGHAKYEEAKDD